MSQRHKSNRARYQKTANNGSFYFVAFGWVLGALMGSVATAVVITKSSKQPPTLAAAKVVAPESAKQANHPKFDFYTILTAPDVVDTWHPNVTLAAKAAPKPISKVDNERYILQLASFKSAAEAEEQKARFALIGIEVSIEQVDLDGKTWFRVRQGPITGLAEAEKIQQQLRLKNINSLRLKLQG